MISLGRDRVRFVGNKQRKGQMESLSNWGETLTASGIDKLVIHLRAIRKKIEKGVAGKAFALLSPITHLPPQQVAACSIRTVIDSLSACNTLHSVAMDISEKLWIETMLDRATKDELFMFRRGRSRKTQKLSLLRRFRHSDDWNVKERMASGTFLVQLIAKETGLIEIVLDNSYQPPRRVIKATDECMAWINDVKEAQEMMTPNYLPTLIPPRDWTTPLEGGYHKKLPLTLLKSNSELVAEHCSGDEMFIQAANIHQSVAWKVNTQILEHQEHAYDLNLEIGCLLPRNGYSVPAYPKHQPEDHPDVAVWKAKAKAIHERNDRTKSARIGIAKTLWVARRFKDEEQLFFPMSLDWRGRYYYRPPYLNPQGNDVSRSLLLFANPQPIETEADADWLRIHGANLYGLKSNFQTRIDWVNEHEQLITGAGTDPWLSPEFWMRADKPWCFLAFCCEYKSFKSHGLGYKSSLPIMLDCTASGIQHFAGLLKSEELGKHVNLFDDDQPQDIYGHVITKVNEQLRIEEDERAGKWLTLQPDRSLAKPAVMTCPYSATRTAFFYYCHEWAQKRARDLFGSGAWTTQTGSMTTMHYMAGILHKQTTELIKPAVQAMEWFKKVGRVAGKQNTSLNWISPSGLFVHQEYKNTRKTRIRLRYLSDVHLDIGAQINEWDLDSKRMGNALSPNVLHSLDSSHMALTTVNARIKYNITNIGGVHDCFVSSPGEMSKLRDCVRESFADMYSVNWFEKITNTLIQQLPRGSDLPPKPKQGNLDLSVVKTSNYFIT